MEDWRKLRQKSKENDNYGDCAEQSLNFLKLEEKRIWIGVYMVKTKGGKLIEI